MLGLWFLFQYLEKISLRLAYFWHVLVQLAVYAYVLCALFLKLFENSAAPLGIAKLRKNLEIFSKAFSSVRMPRLCHCLCLFYELLREQTKFINFRHSCQNFGVSLKPGFYEDSCSISSKFCSNRLLDNFSLLEKFSLASAIACCASQFRLVSVCTLIRHDKHYEKGTYWLWRNHRNIF